MFIRRLADYLIVNTMHVLAVNSVSTLLNYLTEQLKQTPMDDAIMNWTELVGFGTLYIFYIIQFSIHDCDKFYSDYIYSPNKWGEIFLSLCSVSW